MKWINVCLAALTACVAYSQTSSSSFEIATVKPSDPAATGTRVAIAPGGTFQARNVTLRSMILQAYDVLDFQLSGGPGWINTERYDIEAKGNGPAVSKEVLSKMNDDQRNQFEQQMFSRIRALLEERFQLRIHREMKDRPVYALILAKSGSKVGNAVERDSSTPQYGLATKTTVGGRIEMTAKEEPMGRWAHALSTHVGRTVIDKTGLKGNFNFKITFAPDLSDNEGPSIFTALEEQLGLKLEAGRGSVEVVVIDGVEHPSAN